MVFMIQKISILIILIQPFFYNLKIIINYLKAQYSNETQVTILPTYGNDKGGLLIKELSNLDEYLVAMWNSEENTYTTDQPICSARIIPHFYITATIDLHHIFNKEKPVIIEDNSCVATKVQ